MIDSEATTLDRGALIVPDQRYRSDGRRMEFWRTITHLGSAPATVLPGLILFALGGPERAVGLGVLLVNLVSHLIAQLLKRSIARPRPCDASGRLLALIDLPDPFSFPSGHATAAAAVAGVLCLAYGWLTPMMLPLAALVAASRVRLGVHHASDAAAGAFLGLATAVTLFPLLA